MHIDMRYGKSQLNLKMYTQVLFIRKFLKSKKLDQDSVAVDLLNDGFKIKNNGNESNEGNGTNWYCYAAWAETPAVYSVAR